ncbi:MAG: SCP2 sterol-binding domain-containing protein [Pseudomonadota bacterium]|nr:SCP2 sterol-binding domain-containing protein [Pseudomonadota bacterium]
MTPATTLAAALETALDLYLKQDPQALRRCAALEGKIIGLDITGLGLSLYILPGSDGIQVSSHYEGDVDTRLTGSPFGFARLALESREDALFKGAVEIKGDTEAGQELQDLLANTDWDWEEQLSHITGDIIARQIGNIARLSKQFISGSRDTLEQDVSEYLQEEARLLPTRAEVDDFLEDVDQLRLDVDRLDARIERLLRTMDSEP